MHRFLPLLAFAALIGGCGSSSSSTASSTAGALTLSESEFKITPASQSVAAGRTVTITVHNTGAITHALTVQTPSGAARTGDIAPGSSTTLKVDASKPGHYTFFCPIDGHRASGMQGVLVVG